MAVLSSSDAPGHTDYAALARRMGYDVLERRILKQASLWSRETHQGEGLFRLERVIPMDATISFILKISGFAGLGYRNFLDLQVVERDLCLPNLPAAFDGFRLLQLTDLHCDLAPELIDVLIERLRNLPYDAVALTGDYHNKIGEDCSQSLELMSRLVPHLHGPLYAVLGNHDFIEQVVFLETLGLRVLLNESESLERDGDRLWFCGVDDPHFFRTDDLSRSAEDIPAGDTKLLLSHTPEPFQQAAALGFAAMFCGHTHGGQICLPGQIPILQNIRGPRRLLSGPWQEGTLQGYTSRGTGGCGVAARFFCPPEITIHTLRRK